MKTRNFVLCMGLLACVGQANGQSSYKVGNIDMTRVEYEHFRVPDNAFRGVRFIALDLNHPDEKKLDEEIAYTAQSGKWGSFVLIAGGGSTEGLSDDYLRLSGRKPQKEGIAYLSDAYFKLYEHAIKTGLKYGLKASTLYDEWQYPSGMAEGHFYSRYPNDCAKSLEVSEADVSDASPTVLTLPEGCLYVGAVAMNMATYERIDISQRFDAGRLTYTPAPGKWKVMLFYLDPAFTPRGSKGGVVDYLDRAAVGKYIDMTFGAYYKHLKKYFGTVLERSFYDEPTLMSTHGRMWTPGFNDGFKARYGYNPMTLYPALWHDIGAETASARNALYKYRTELFAENYIGQVSAWCEAHGIKGGGHLDQEEARNPVGANGDLMKAFKYQSIPATDDIYYPGRSNVGYKIVSSACYNWDKPEMFTETFAAYSRPQYKALTSDNYMRVSLDQMTMGTNIQIEFEKKFYGVDSLLGRGGYLLRGGRHVADIAVVYPIAALQSAFTLPSRNLDGHYYSYMGGAVPAEIDYMDIGESLFRGLRMDYTYLHPEVLSGQCTVEGNELKLNNSNNWEQYRIVILPGGDTFSVEAARKLLAFYQAGGTVIATSKLPTKSAEAGHDEELRDIVFQIFGISDSRLWTCKVKHSAGRFENIFYQKNAAGGTGYFIDRPNTSVLEEIINPAMPVRDVDMGLLPDYYVRMNRDYSGGVTYIHKVRDGQDIYLFANTTDNAVTSTVTLRGNKSHLEFWDPHTGERKVVETTLSEKNGVPTTSFNLSLEALHGLFVVGK